MIEFMVIALPRSGTAWAANWLTTAETLCLHDPLWSMHYDELDSYRSAKRVGVACTGLWRFPRWLAAHPAKKLIVHRPLGEIRASCDRIGMPSAAFEIGAWLDDIKGLHVSHRELFTDGKRIWRHLIGATPRFDEERYNLLRTLRIERDLHQVHIDPEASRRLLRELAEAAT